MSVRTSIRAKLANAERRLKADPTNLALRAEVDRLRAEYRSEALREHIERVVAGAPPLTSDQRARLAVLLSAGTAA